MRSQSQPPASAAALRWLEGAFAGLRTELQSLRGHVDQQQSAMAELIEGITQQQMMLSELLDTRDADFAVIELAEALPQLVSDAVAAQVRDDRRRTVTEIRSAVEEKLEEKGQQTRGPEDTAAELRAFLQNDPSTRSIVAAVATQAATRAMRTEVAEQLEAIVAQSDARMNELSERMDAAVAERIDKLMATVKRAATPPAPKASARVPKSGTPAAKAAKVAKAPAAKAKSKATTAKSRATKAVKTTRAAKATKAAKPTRVTKATKAGKATTAEATVGATTPRKSSPTRAQATKPAAADTAPTAAKRPSSGRRTAAGASGRTSESRARSRARSVPPVSERDLDAEMAVLLELP